MSTTDLTGSTALVTGATSGIGRSIALLLARRGAHVLVSGRDAARGDAVVATIREAGGKADFIATSPATTPASSTAPCSTSTAAATRRRPWKEPAGPGRAASPARRYLSALARGRRPGPWGQA